ncbi:MAG: RNA polymerase sigma factor [Lachnospiraceae bacterium]|nr:RNA polymerase sigma factor [Lachnospiraceae bacterium]
MDTDYFLIKKMRRGDEKAFDTFVNKYYPDVLRYCFYHCQDKEEAKDLAQDTFLHFFRGFSDYKYRGKTKNYLYTIAGNLCKNFYKKTKEYLTESLDDTVFAENMLSGQFSENYMEKHMTTQLVVRICLEKLKEEYREVLILYYYQELKQSEIADLLGIGLPLVKYRLKKAKEQMEIFLRMEGFDEY